MDRPPGTPKTLVQRHVAQPVPGANAFSPARSTSQPSSVAPRLAVPSARPAVKSIRLAQGGGTDYQAMCKVSLGTRWLRVLAFSFGATFCISVVVLFLRGSRSVVTSWLASVIFFMLSVLPTLVLRKAMLSQPEVIFPSVFARTRWILSSPSSHVTAMVFAAAGVIQALAFSFVLEMSSSSHPRLGPFASSTKHPLHLNERFLLLVASNISVGALYAFRELFTDAFLPKWPNQIAPLGQLVIARLVSMPAALPLAFLHPVAFAVLHLVLRRPFWRFVLSWFGLLARPYVGSFVRASHHPLDGSLLVTMIALEVLTLASWEIGKALVQVYMSQPLILSHISSSPTRSLLAGLSSPSIYYRHFAQFETAHVYSTSADRRATLFKDMSSPTTAWNDVWQAEISLLERSHQTLVARGATPPPPALSPSVSTSHGAPLSSASTPAYSVPTTIKPSTESIFLPSRKSLYDAVASKPTATSSSAPQARSELPPAALSSTPTLSKVPSIFTSSIQVSPVAVAQSTTARAAPSSQRSILDVIAAPLGQIGRAAWSKLPDELRATIKFGVQPLTRTVAREKVRGSVKASLPNRQDDLLVIETLAALVSASLDEDPYGQVQRDIPRTLEVLLSFLTSLDAFVTELEGAAKGEQEVAETRAVLAAEVDDLVTANRMGIRRIVETFRDHLGAFKLSSSVTAQLKPFVE